MMSVILKQPSDINNLVADEKDHCKSERDSYLYISIYTIDLLVHVSLEVDLRKKISSAQLCKCH